MARQCYKLNLNGEEYKLRLTMAGQKALLELHPDQNALAIIMGAVDDLSDMEALLTEALNWEGNNNKIHSGAELYDELVDAGYCGRISACRSGCAGAENFDRSEKSWRKNCRCCRRSCLQCGIAPDDGGKIARKRQIASGSAEILH